MKSTSLLLAVWIAWLAWTGIATRGEGAAEAAAATPPPGAVAPTAYAPKIAPASDEAARQIASFRLRDGFTASLFAAEPLVANPVCFWMDWQGRCYVAESFRQETEGVPDNRSHTYWIPDDLEARTVADRRAMYLKHHPEYAKRWTRAQDRIRRLVDDDRDGIADRSEVFADGFDDLLDGTGAGVLSVGSDVFYTCIPHLWRLRDRDGDGFAETRDRLHSGFGVRVALRGHDMHGLVRGPDGRLYFSIGDRGYNVETPEGRQLVDPRSGAVFRCNPDGSGLEVYATGLRNPQELAFDDFGNLFTGDNNGDGGDKARVVYVAEGGETGWRMNYQYIPKRGPWVLERWYEPEHEGRVAAYLPPIANLGSGPSGLVCYPGTGLPEAYDGWFFLCDFLGSAGHSGVRAFRLEPRGAGFALVEDHWFVKGLLATDCDFGADGVLYVSDWVQGWVGEGKGRVYAIRHAAARDPAVRATRRLLAHGVDRLPFHRHLELLSHPDRRVRQEAQFACAARGATALGPLRRVLRERDDLRARVHATWALGQMQGRVPEAAPVLTELLEDGEAEVRAQAARVLGDARTAAATAALRRRLADDPSSRVRYFAALALGRLGDPGAIPLAVRALAENADADVFLRHALVMALVGTGDAARLEPFADHAAVAVRRGVLLAWRRLGDARLVRYLGDPDRGVALEAARAIYDRPIPAGYAALAALTGDLGGARPWHPAYALARRALSCRDLLGRPEDVRALVDFARRPEVPSELRRFALRALDGWDPAPRTEPILNDVRPRPARRLADVDRALGDHLEAMLDDASEGVREVAARLCGRLGRTGASPRLRALVGDAEVAESVRIAALVALDALASEALAPAITAALRSDRPRLRGRAAALLAEGDPERALPILERAATSARAVERQLALRTLGRMAHPAADALLARRLRAQEEDPHPEAELLELLEAARARAERDPEGALARRFRAHEAAMRDAPIAVRHRSALEGGDPEAGRRVFEGATASCIRCHSLEGERSELAGPPLGGVALRLGAVALLESVVDPDARIAEGYATALIETTDGELVDGRILQEGEGRLVMEVLDSGTPERVEIPLGEVAFRKASKSAMPKDLVEKLGPGELRDLLAFLGTLRSATPKSKDR